MKGVAILGSTGSIGVNALDVVRSFPTEFKVVSLAAGRRIERLAEQVEAFRPRLVSVARSEDASRLRQLLSPSAREGLQVTAGVTGAEAVAEHPDVEIVVTAMVGAVGLRPTLAAIRRGCTVGIANKEPLVMAGELCRREAETYGATLLPIDSEHSAIFQCLNGERKSTVSKLILTCSGGPFRSGPQDLSSVSLEQALEHPTWSMGPKITIDSSTLMNKGLEVIEAHWLFGLPPTQIEILIHPQSVVHSMVEFVDGAVIAQLGTPDMRGPIGYALGYPDRLPLDIPRIDWSERAQLSFERPDYGRFRGPRLAYDVIDAGGTAPTVLNAANEAAVAAFLQRKIRYVDIIPVIEQTLAAHDVADVGNLELILAADDWARKQASSVITARR